MDTKPKNQPVQSNNPYSASNEKSGRKSNRKKGKSNQFASDELMQEQTVDDNLNIMNPELDDNNSPYSDIRGTASKKVNQKKGKPDPFSSDELMQEVIQDIDKKLQIATSKSNDNSKSQFIPPASRIREDITERRRRRSKQLNRRKPGEFACDESQQNATVVQFVSSDNNGERIGPNENLGRALNRKKGKSNQLLRDESIRNVIKNIKEKHLHGSDVRVFNDYMTNVLKLSVPWRLEDVESKFKDVVHLNGKTVVLVHMIEDDITPLEEQFMIRKVNSDGTCDNSKVVISGKFANGFVKYDSITNEMIPSPTSPKLTIEHVKINMNVGTYLKYALDPISICKFDKTHPRPHNIVKIDPLRTVILNFDQLLTNNPGGIPVNDLYDFYEYNYGKFHSHLYGFTDVYDILAHLSTLFCYRSSSNGELNVFKNEDHDFQINISFFTKLRLYLIVYNHYPKPIDLNELIVQYEHTFNEKLTVEDFHVTDIYNFLWALNDIIILHYYAVGACLVRVRRPNVFSRRWMYCDHVIGRATDTQGLTCLVDLHLLPLPAVGDTIRVVITNVKSLESFYAIPQRYFQELENLTDEMESFYNQWSNDMLMLKVDNRIRPGRLCAVLIPGNTPLWARCRILRTVNEYLIEVFAIDRGLFFEVHQNNIMMLPAKFYTLPELALRAKLYRVDDLTYSKEFDKLYCNNLNGVTIKIMEVNNCYRILSCLIVTFTQGTTHNEEKFYQLLPELEMKKTLITCEKKKTSDQKSGSVCNKHMRSVSFSLPD